MCHCVIHGGTLCVVMSSIPVSSPSHRGSVGLWAIFTAPKKTLIQYRYTHISECFLLARLRRRINVFFRPKRRKQAFIGRQNKRPSSAVLLSYAVTRWRGLRAFPQSPIGCHEVNFAEKRLPSAIPITGRRFTHVFEQCIVCCIAFRLL